MIDVKLAEAAVCFAIAFVAVIGLREP